MPEKNTTYSKTDGHLTGKTVTTTKADGTKEIEQFAMKQNQGVIEQLFTSCWEKTSETRVDSKGNSTTKTFK